MEPKSQSQAAELPEAAHGGWRIELRMHPILHRGHAFLTLVDPEGVTRAELHGMARSRNRPEQTGEDEGLQALGLDGSQLHTWHQTGPIRTRMWKNSEKIGDVAYGTYDEIANGKWAKAVQAGHDINRRNLDYKGHDPSYEIGGDGGQIQNSNSANYTIGKAADLDLDRAISDRAVFDERLPRRLSGWGRDLLDPGYKPYVAPTTFPVANAP